MFRLLKFGYALWAAIISYLTGSAWCWWCTTKESVWASDGTGHCSICAFQRDHEEGWTQWQCGRCFLHAHVLQIYDTFSKCSGLCNILLQYRYPHFGCSHVLTCYMMLVLYALLLHILCVVVALNDVMQWYRVRAVVVPHISVYVCGVYGTVPHIMLIVLYQIMHWCNNTCSYYVSYRTCPCNVVHHCTCI